MKDKTLEFIEKWIASIDLRKELTDLYRVMNERHNSPFLYRFDKPLTTEQFNKLKSEDAMTQLKAKYELRKVTP